MKVSEIVMTVVAVGLVTLFFTLLSKRQRDAVWTGKVIKKRYSYDEESGKHKYQLIFRTDEGKKKKMAVSKQVYEESIEGDRFEKLAGEYVPVKLVD